MHRTIRLPLLPAVALALALAFAPAVTRAGTLSTSASAASPSSILVQWTWWEDPLVPIGHPEWVGYDVYRRATSAPCAEYVRVNPDIVPRTPGVTQDASWLDASAVPGTMYEYRVRLVDAARTPLALPPPDCLGPCNPPAYASCPDLSASIVVGTVTEWGWAVQVQSCTGCWEAFYVENPAANALRPYAETSQAVRLWGRSTCGTMEGCALQLDRFELADCGATPTQRRTWGALKSIYR